MAQGGGEVVVGKAGQRGEVVVGKAGQRADVVDEQVVFVPYERKPLQQRLLAEEGGGNGARAWPRLNDPGLLLEPSLLNGSGDSAKADEWDVTPTSFGAGSRWLRCGVFPALRGSGAVKRCGWRHCCCITSAVLLLAIITVLIMYLGLVGERQQGLPPPPPGLIQPPGAPSTPSLEVQLISYLGVAWTAPVTSGGAAVLNWIVETAPAEGGPFAVAATLVSSARYYGTGGLSGAQTLCFRVTAGNNAGLGNSSLPSCFDTLPPVRHTRISLPLRHSLHTNLMSLRHTRTSLPLSHFPIQNLMSLRIPQALPMPPGSLFPTSGTSVSSTFSGQCIWNIYT